MQFQVIVVTDPHTNPQTQTDRQDRLQYTVPQLACRVTSKNVRSQVTEHSLFNCAHVIHSQSSNKRDFLTFVLQEIP